MGTITCDGDVTLRIDTDDCACSAMFSEWVTMEMKRWEQAWRDGTCWDSAAGKLQRWTVSGSARGFVRGSATFGKEAPGRKE